MMQYRRLGRSNLRVSTVGFGTCQARRVPEQQVIDALKCGFELGVNLVHTAPDYEGADELVAQAVAESGHPVMIASQGYGDLAHFEWLFECSRRKFKKQRLEMFGIACIDDREYLGEPVWGSGGVVEFLLRKKAEGQLGAIFCTTHGPPEYVANLIASGVFDAIMLAYNALGFHLLSYHPGSTRRFENIGRNCTEIFPLAARNDVGLMIMKPLAGGLLCESKSFPPRAIFPNASDRLTATEILRAILVHPEVSCVVPGTTSIVEAEENARAGHDGTAINAYHSSQLDNIVEELRATVCCRCGYCDSLCSKQLPISWLFRDAYIMHYPSETFETIDPLRYFHLHPGEKAACSTCANVTCSCPYGINIPASLSRVHGEMILRRNEGVLPEPNCELGKADKSEVFAASLITREIPRALRSGESTVCRIYVQNVGREVWAAARGIEGAARIELAVFMDGSLQQAVSVRHNVEPGARTHFSFAISAPEKGASISLNLVLRAINNFDAESFFEIGEVNIPLRPPSS
jgi:predicted aldo/keto reductase-like oxidoreductase